MEEPRTRTKEDFLRTRVGSLGIELASSVIAPAVSALYDELDAAAITFHPLVYLSDRWGVPPGVPVIGIPFYLADETLREIELERMRGIEGDDDIRRILRHEAGHAFQYAHQLHRLPRWQELFGVYRRPYRDEFLSGAGHNKFVRHLEGWYGKKHPDETFAEAFAFLITPGSDWKTVYRGTRAHELLSYAAELLKEYGKKPVAVSKQKFKNSLPQLNVTLEEWYRDRTAAQKPREKVLMIYYQTYPKTGPMPEDPDVVRRVRQALVDLNYDVVLLPVNQTVEHITKSVKEEKPSLVFNLCDTFMSRNDLMVNVIALLEMLEVPFTGSGSGAMFLSTDKHLSKKIFDFHRIPYPAFFVVPRGQIPEVPRRLTFPLFTKPVREDASVGVDESSVVHNDEELRARVNYVHETVKDDALVEEYIDGREFFVTVLGHGVIKPLEALELDFSSVPPGEPRVYSHKAKFARGSDEFKAIMPKIAADLAPEVRKKLNEYALHIFRAFGAKSYIRVDFRMSPEGRICVLEANLNPYLAEDAETVISARASGMTYEELIGEIVDIALARPQVE